MKKIIFLSLAILLLLVVKAQDYQVAFHAQGISTEMDSVEIENISQGKDTVVYGEDILHLLGSVKVNENSIAQSSLTLYPNPTSGAITMEFFCDKEQEARLELLDVSGKVLYSKKQNVFAGQNTVKLSGFSKGTYFVYIYSKDFRFTENFVSVADGDNNIIVNYENTYASNKGVKTKSSKSAINWQYNDGDILIFRAYADGNSRVSVYYINANTDLYFDFVLCQDADAYKYPVTTIGSVTYMAENLHTSKYNNNSPIPEVTDNTEWGALITGGRCYFDNDSATYVSDYGALYNFAAVNTGNLCPIGWHIPTETEWQDLLIYLQNNGFNYTGFIDTDNDHTTNNYTSKSLSATSLWTTTDVVGTPGNTDNPNYRNRSGFSAIGAGMRNPSIGNVTNLERVGKYWSSTIFNEGYAKGLSIQFDIEGANIGNDTKTYGQSVRCVKN